MDQKVSLYLCSWSLARVTHPPEPSKLSVTWVSSVESGKMIFHLISIVYIPQPHLPPHLTTYVYVLLEWGFNLCPQFTRMGNQDIESGKQRYFIQ